MVDGGSHDGSVEFARDNGIETYVQKKRGIRFAYIEAWPLIRGNLVITFSPGGDVLFVLPTPASEEAPPVPLPWSSQVPVSTDDSLRLQYVVEAFDANNLRVRVVNPGSGSWMFYSDVWHPSWRATVNGKPVPVYRADLAYKAVPLAAGENVVLLRFGSTTFSWCAMLLAMNALAWLGGLSWMM